MPVKHDAPAAWGASPLFDAAIGSAPRSECIEYVEYGSCTRACATALGDADRPNTSDRSVHVMNALVRQLAATALFFLLGYGIPAARAAVLMPGDAAIALAGESGKASETRTFSFVLDGGEKPPVLVAGDLLRTAPSPARIDRSHVRVTPAAASPAGLANYEITVTGLPERYGSYQGSITVHNGTASANGSGEIAVTLLVRVPATLPLTALPPAIVLPLAAGNTSGRSILSNWPSAGDMHVGVAGLPAGAEVAGARMTPLVSARGYGELGAKKYGAEASPAGLRLHVDAAQARPDKYTAIAEIDLAGSDRRIAVPVEVTVRAAPAYVVALLVLGIVLGRAAKWMNEDGQKLLAAQGRLNSLALRAAALDPDYRPHLEEPMAGLQRILNQDRLGDFDAALAVMLALIETFERVSSLRALARLRANAGAVTRLDDIATELRFLSSAESAKARLDLIESELTNGPGNANAAAAASARANVSRSPRMRWRSAKLRIASGLRTVLELSGVALLAFVGYEVLYLNGSPTFGANFSDYFGVLVWGLGADVAARTITALGRVPSR